MCFLKNVFRKTSLQPCCQPENTVDIQKMITANNVQYHRAAVGTKSRTHILLQLAKVNIISFVENTFLSVFRFILIT